MALVVVEDPGPGAEVPGPVVDEPDPGPPAECGVPHAADSAATQRSVAAALARRIDDAMARELRDAGVAGMAPAYLGEDSGRLAPPDFCLP